MGIEECLLNEGVWPLCGVDEAGRGPLAGPVVAAAVVIMPGSNLRGIMKDSKALTSSGRETLYDRIMQSPHAYVGISQVDVSVIDGINILKATLLAMKMAVANLGIKPVKALIDGNIAPDLFCESITVVRGDATEPSISAASIIAKVIRDRYMIHMDSIYPGYGFAQHKGYGTIDHYKALREQGITPIHRRSFRGVL